MLRALHKVAQSRLATERAFSSIPTREWSIYLSGEIHSDWRDQISSGIEAAGLPVVVTSPNCSHEDSDDCGAIILGDEER